MNIVDTWCESVETRLGKINDELGDLIEKVAELKGRADLLIWFFGLTVLAVAVDIVLRLPNR